MKGFVFFEEQPKPAQKEFKFEMKQNVSEKNTALASKLALMKLKQTAQGPPGLTEQFKYFCSIRLTEQTGPTTHPFFFSTKWPLGKCLEFVESKLNLASSQAFRFFVDELQLDLSSTVEDLIKNGPLSNQGIVISLRSTLK